MITMTCKNADMLMLAVEAVLTDKGFTVQSPLAVNALKSANEFLAWCRTPENHSNFKSFSSEVVAHLMNAIPETLSTSC